MKQSNQDKDDILSLVGKDKLQIGLELQSANQRLSDLEIEIDEIEASFEYSYNELEKKYKDLEQEY